MRRHINAGRAMIMPGIAWQSGRFEFSWHRAEVGGAGGKLWWRADGRVWVPGGPDSAAEVRIRRGVYCIAPGGRRMTGREAASLRNYLDSLATGKMPF